MAPTHARSPRSRASAWRHLLPREHGVWAWVGLPLLLGLVLAPGASALLAALSVVAGLGATQGLGRVLRGVTAARTATAAATLLAAALAGAAWVTAERPLAWAVTLATSGAFGIGATYLTRGRPPRRVSLEVVSIAVFVGTGAGVALAGGAVVERTLVAALALLAWLVLGLWWVKGRLASVLARREPWSEGAWVAGVLVVASVATAAAVGPWLVGCVPLAYGLRVLAHPAPTSAREAKRVGLQELAWGVAATLAVGLV